MTFVKKITKFLIKKIIKKIEIGLNKKNVDFKKIIITGTVGKTSLTLMINELFNSNGYCVISGTSQKKGLNTLEGLGITLMRYLYQSKNKNDGEKVYNLEIEDKKGIAKLFLKIKYIVDLFYYSFAFNFKATDSKTVLIYEVGFDTQNEGVVFENLFGNIDYSVVNCLTHEHSGNFSDIFDTKKYLKIKNKIHSKLQSEFENSSIPAVVKNIALEQFAFINETSKIVYPTTLNKITNEMIINDSLIEIIPQRDKNFNLYCSYNNKNLVFNNSYLLPDTFAKNISVVGFFNNEFNFNMDILEQVIASKNIFPNSRFSRFIGKNGSTIIDSSYNSDPSSLLSFIENVQEVSRFQANNINTLAPVQISNLLILGEMRELGIHAKQTHGEVLLKLVDLINNPNIKLKEILLLGKEWLQCDESKIKKSEGNVQFIKFKNVHFKVFLKAGDINKYLDTQIIIPENWIWIKGSQNTIFLELVVEHLLEDKRFATELCRRGKDWDQVRKNYL